MTLCVDWKYNLVLLGFTHQVYEKPEMAQMGKIAGEIEKHIGSFKLVFIPKFT